MIDMNNFKKKLLNDLDNDGLTVLGVDDFQRAAGILKDERGSLFFGYDRKRKVGIISLLEE